MKKFLTTILIGFVALSSYAQKPDQQYISGLQKYYSDIDKDVFRDSRRVLRNGFMKDYKAYGAGVVDGKGSSKRITLKGFSDAYEVETHDVFYNDWDVEIGCPTDFPIFENDLVYLTFWVRCLGSRDESNQGFARVYLQQNGPPWLKSADVSIVAGSEWVEYKIPFRAKFQNYNAKQAAVAFAMGYSHQTLQIADIRVTNLGTFAKEDDLPRTKFSYDGREEDAQWRKDALARIEKIRKGDLKVIVKDKKGNLVPDAKVNVEMLRHTFGFGNIVNKQHFGNPGPKGQKYRKIIKENFNQVTFENALKHDMWLLQKSEGRTDRIFNDIDTLDAWNIDLRGHALVWPSTRYTKVSKFFIDKGNKDGLRGLVKNHISEITAATKGRVVDWDVVNEPYINHQFMDILGKNELLEWFKLARQIEPDADLYINETRFLIDGGVNKNVQDNLYEWVEYLQENNVDINGLGFQGHFGETGLTSPKKVLEIFDRFGKLGLKLKITELDITTLDDDLQADFFSDFCIAVYSHPAANAIISWGFWEDAHWRPDACWYRSDFTPKPIAQVHKDLVFKKWWTNESGKASSSGEFLTRGYCGDYKVTVESNGKMVSKEFELTNKGETVEVTLK